jgi:hypothetical protein
MRWIAGVGIALASAVGGAILESGTKIIQDRISPVMADINCRMEEVFRSNSAYTSLMFVLAEDPDIASKEKLGLTEDVRQLDALISGLDKNARDTLFDRFGKGRGLRMLLANRVPARSDVASAIAKRVWTEISLVRKVQQVTTREQVLGLIGAIGRCAHP